MRIFVSNKNNNKMSTLKQLIHDIDSTRTEYLNKKEILKRLLEIERINKIEVNDPVEVSPIKVGDRVRVVGGSIAHHFKIGEVVRVLEIETMSDTWYLCTNGKLEQNLIERDIVKVS